MLRQQAVALMEANFGSGLSRKQLAAGAGRLPFQPAVPSGGGGESPPVTGGLPAAHASRTAGRRPETYDCRGGPRMRLCRPGAFNAAFPAHIRGEPRPVPKRARMDNNARTAVQDSARALGDAGRARSVGLRVFVRARQGSAIVFAPAS